MCVPVCLCACVCLLVSVSFCVCLSVCVLMCVFVWGRSHSFQNAIPKSAITLPSILDEIGPTFPQETPTPLFAADSKFSAQPRAVHTQGPHIQSEPCAGLP